MYYRIPALELSLSVPLVLQAVFRRAGARGLIYDFLLLSCGIRLLMFQPCFDRILICQLFGPWYSTPPSPPLTVLKKRDMASSPSGWCNGSHSAPEHTPAYWWRGDRVMKHFDNLLALQAKVQSLFAEGAVEMVPPVNSESGFYSHYILFPKKGGGSGPSSILNAWIRP